MDTEKSLDSMNIPGTFEVYDTKTGRWRGTFINFKDAEKTADLLNRRSGSRRYDWRVVK